MTPRAWIVGAYGENGGNHMNHHIGKICRDTLGLETRSIGIGSSVYKDPNLFNHDRIFEEFSLQDFLKSHQEDDILVSNPSFSKYLLGLKSNCKKVMYVQHYNTFRRLDLGFDVYVAVSNCVKSYLSNVYSISAHKISAFTEDAQSLTSYPEKKDKILVYPKFLDDYYDFFIEKIKPNIHKIELEYLDKKMLRNEFLNRIDEHKFLMTLSIDEGFGLVSLEAMKRGCVVFGFDGYGGRDYMIRGYNCYTNNYPDWETVCQSINNHVDNDRSCREVSQHAIKTASAFSHEQFASSWATLLSNLLNG